VWMGWCGIGVIVSVVVVFVFEGCVQLVSVALAFRSGRGRSWCVWVPLFQSRWWARSGLCVPKNASAGLVIAVVTGGYE